MNTTKPDPMNPITTHDSLLAICLYAAFSNGEQSDAERKEIARYAEEMDADNLAVLKYAILNGALELLPQTLATVVIIPMQMKMVYRIGKSHGVELDRSNIKDFLATAGIGLGSQMVEGFARKLVGKFGRKLGGKTVGKVADQLTGSALSFGSTYAIGHMAQSYYAGGGTLTAPDLKKLVGSLQCQAHELHHRYLPEIQERAKTLDSAAILSLVRGKTPV